MQLRTVFLFVLVCWIWGSTWLAIRLGLNGVPPFTGAAIRMTSSGVLLLLVTFALRQPWPKQSIYPAHIAVQGLLLFGLQYALIYWAEQTVPSGLAAVLFAVVPILTAIIAAFIFKIERLTPTNMLGLFIGFCGVAVIYWSEVINAAHTPAPGVVAMLLAAVSASVATVFAKRYAHDIPPVATVGPGQLLGGIGLGALALVAEHGKAVQFNAVSTGALVYLTIVGSAIVFLAYFSLMRTIAVTRLSLITYVIPVVAVTLGALFAHERLAPHTFLGAALIFAGIGLVQQRAARTAGATAK